MGNTQLLESKELYMSLTVSRGKGIVLLCPQVVGVQVEHADHERQEDQDEDDHKLEDVLDCPPQRDLQWAEALIGWEDVGDPREAQHHCDCVQALRYQLGV